MSDEGELLSQEISEMDEEELRVLVSMVARRDGLEDFLDAVEVIRGTWVPSEGMVRNKFATAMETVMEYRAEDARYGRDGSADDYVARMVEGTFSDRVLDLLDAGRTDDAVKLLRLVAEAARDPDIPWKGTPRKMMRERQELADRIERCIAEGRMREALEYDGTVNRWRRTYDQKEGQYREGSGTDE